MAVETVPLTNELHVEQGAHILYFYSDLQEYVRNAASYIQNGIQLGQHVIFIDSLERYQLVRHSLASLLTEEQFRMLYYVNNYDFYELYHDFHFSRILKNLQQIIEPYLVNRVTVRLWGHVEWLDRPEVHSQLCKYEHQADLTIAELGFTTVCAYNGRTVPSYILQETLRSHEYLMTDNELVRSFLYANKKPSQTVYPSLALRDEIVSERDLYKQKLDFVHVVSHEVRNPLTVIKAYAAILLREETVPDKIQKLQTIIDYAIVIDNEISHIISTEQMLSTEALWRKKLVQVRKAIEEVISIMTPKARTQNIALQCQIDLHGQEIINANQIGLKLIVSNLLSNAIKYSNEGETVHFRAGVTDGRLQLEVIDHGCGMSEEQMEKLFRKYEKWNQEQSGQGIGLFMVKKLVDHFGGTISVTSKLNEGSAFVVELPL